jgi:hypothetical protein
MTDVARTNGNGGDTVKMQLVIIVQEYNNRNTE